MSPLTPAATRKKEQEKPKDLPYINEQSLIMERKKNHESTS